MTWMSGPSNKICGRLRITQSLVDHDETVVSIWQEVLSSKKKVLVMRRRPDLLIVGAELYSKKDWMDLKYPWENHESDLSNEKLFAVYRGLYLIYPVTWGINVEGEYWPTKPPQKRQTWQVGVELVTRLLGSGDGSTLLRAAGGNGMMGWGCKNNDDDDVVGHGRTFLRTPFVYFHC